MLQTAICEGAFTCLQSSWELAANLKVTSYCSLFRGTIYESISFFLEQLSIALGLSGT